MTKNEHQPILIASPPRSGSSLTASLVAAAGVFGGKMKPGDRWNKYGYFENLAVMSLEIEHLRLHDETLLGKRFHPVSLNGSDPIFGRRVISALRRDGLGDEPWFYKSTKMPICWRMWSQHFPGARWVWVVRRRGEIIKSLMRTEFMDAYRTEAEWENFLDVYDTILYEMMRSCTCRIFAFDIHTVFRGELEHVRELLEFIGTGSVDEVLRVVEKDIWHGEK